MKATTLAYPSDVAEGGQTLYTGDIKKYVNANKPRIKAITAGPTP